MAAILPFSPIFGADSLLTRVQQAIKKTFDQFTGNALLTGVFVTVSFSAANSDTTVNHGLGTTNVGWFAGSLSDNATIFTSPSTAATSSSITLQASAETSATLYVYIRGS